VKNHDHATTRFQIGGLTVIYDIDGTIPDTIVGDMPVPTNNNNWNGIFVEVKGTSLSGTTLTATKVEPENQGIGNNVDELEVEGFVTNPGPANGNIIEFTIEETLVRTTASTLFRGGTIDEIVDGAKLSAEGRFDGNTLIAKHVKFHESVKLEGNIAMIATGGNTFTFTITGLPGITVTVNNQTEGGNNLLVNNHVRVRGRVTGTSSVIATRIELQPGNTDDVDLQGPVQDDPVVVPNLTILGVPVDTLTINNDNFEGRNDQVIGRAAFFSVVKTDTLVKVKGRLVNGVVTWREAELED
jgi:cytoskeletal protein CcmA (bactofilin family)